MISLKKIGNIEWNKDFLIDRYNEAPVMVRSNTIVGDRFHANGMVVARIVKGKICMMIAKFL